MRAARGAGACEPLVTTYGQGPSHLRIPALRQAGRSLELDDLGGGHLDRAFADSEDDYAEGHEPSLGPGVRARTKTLPQLDAAVRRTPRRSFRSDPALARPRTRIRRGVTDDQHALLASR